MGLFEQLQERKANGERLDFTTITPEELTQLYLREEHIDIQIAALYDVTKNQVKYKRQKFGIKYNLSDCFEDFYLQKYEKSTT
jgi:hypothetical protein